MRRSRLENILLCFAPRTVFTQNLGYYLTGRHKSMSKIGASSLRRTLFLVMTVYLQNAPLDEPVYQFMDKKRAEGKPYRVYMMASANKFLRIYYATVKAYLESLEHTA